MLLKKNAPKLYATVAAKRRREIENDIERLRKEYKEEVDTSKRSRILIEGNQLKHYLQQL